MVNPIAQELPVEFEFPKLISRNARFLPISQAHTNLSVSFDREKFAPDTDRVHPVREDNHVWLEVIELHI
jgi:hypothetical protein